MNRSWRTILIVLLALPLLGAVAGRLAAPALARLNYSVRVAEHVWRAEKNPQGAEPRNVPNTELTQAEKDVKAFIATGIPKAMLYSQAREVRGQFASRAIWFGLWCGLVGALKIVATLNGRRRREYDADPALCLACARCYLACPVERERLEHQLGERPL